MTPPPCALDFSASYPSFEEKSLSSLQANDRSYLPILVNEKKAFKCAAPKCEKVFRYKSDIERHCTVHSEDKPFACTHPACNRSFKRVESLRDHLESHSKDLSYTCPHPGCEKVFHKKTIMQYHFRKHHAAKDSSCNSQKCRKAFDALDKLRKHQREGRFSEKEKERTISLKDEQTEVSRDSTSIFENQSPKLWVYNFEESTPSFERNSEPELVKFDPKNLLYVQNEEERQPSEAESSSKRLQDLMSEVQSLMAAQGKNKDLRIESLLQAVLEHLKNENQELKEKLADVLAQIEKEDL